MIDEKRFSAQLFLIVPMVIECIIRETPIDEEKAIGLFYSSELYAQLEDERTKLWHLSPLAKHLTGKQVIELFSHYDITDYIISCYEALHTTGSNYLIEDIDLFIEARQ
ncbi:MAG: DUF3791 domain-containing protein [Spirochaetaceae bacterium]|nr:DUF3791 domain-containing protein [Spirochaetaceae bacterium]